LWLYGLALFSSDGSSVYGHAFEGKPPEFFHDWRFCLWGALVVAKIHGKA